MLCMEGYFQPETTHRPPPLEANIGCNRGSMTLSGSDASSLTAENRKAVIHISENVLPFDGTTWTDTKHSLYLHHLEVSFVKQLHHSKALIEQCSEQNKGGLGISQKRLFYVKIDSEQFKVLQNGCWQKVNYVKSEAISEGTGQNFPYEGSQSASNFESRAKRPKTALAENSLQDQIVPIHKICRLYSDS